ncbi:methyltransferase domain-containing protein [Sorangium sp. So ce363]|uniref:class I SAM-dependent methyltransferase n=1 Tax=Sorangium sp. So ce363 TaxID=3133304 RepID=UPI003F61F947
MNWRIKATVQKALGGIPFGNEIHGWLQRRVGGLSHFEVECEERIGDFRSLLGHLQHAGVRLDRANLLEIGTGWYPALPFGLYLCDVARVYTYDQKRHLDVDLARRCLQMYEKELPTIATAAGIDLRSVRQRHEIASSLVQLGLNEATGGIVEYHAPGDARATGLPDESVDVVFSNNVLEHVTHDAIRDIMTETWRVLRPGGLAIHNVNCGDHYSHFDSTISQLNYLRYSPATWKKWDNAFLYQNRLRASDFMKLARESGLDVQGGTVRPTDEQRKALTTIEVDASFAAYAPDDLCITRFDLVAKKALGPEARSRSGLRSGPAPNVGGNRLVRA